MRHSTGFVVYCVKPAAAESRRPSAIMLAERAIIGI